MIENQSVDFLNSTNASFSEASNLTSSFIACGEDQPLFVFQQESQNPNHEQRFKNKECPIGDPRNILDVTQYQHIIYRSLCQNELEIKRNFFIQDEINFLDRGVAFDSMSHVHYRLNMGTNGLYIAFGIMDKYMTTHQLPRSKLKLYCNAAVFIGSKVEDYRPPRVRDLIRMADHCFGGNTFSSRELYEAEHDLLATIGFNITFGTPLLYMTQLMRISGHNTENILIARYN
ncbi:Cyclin, N-terminal domain containing protein [Trichomonas vaginalis G3]|uniref:Cyclin, N-terminal domain containing protein n=1 Tax=Trichomonas vaginalis (strain ATCC PRA-98 / G3) TaxID=412133 RepID=A2EEG0_TRIV3|nr:Cyclin, N-terminal domain containing protein [Trichomonas vaginalis G3]|eukprot:XP_001321189.1 Cyclin, N-terminal domain containing protein [Trichomonas vaginalis G3]